MTQRKEEGTVYDLCLYRIDISKQDLASARLLFNNDDYRGANNRAYYAIFHAINAVHSLDGHSYKKHRDAISNFNKKYVKTNIFDRSIGRKISDAEELINIVESYCQERIEKETHFS